MDVIKGIAEQMFSLGKDTKSGREEVFGINVFKVREAMHVPEMDGYVLTRKVKGDARFKSIPIVMHSSLSAEANQALGEGVGADAYAAKFQPQELVHTLAKMMLG